MLQIKKNKRFGRHVVTTSAIKKGEVVEISELIVITGKKNTEHIHETILNNYVYAYKKQGVAVALGSGSLFNHSVRPNLRYKVRGKRLIFWAIRDIKKGEQLFVNYGYNPF